MVRQIYGNIKLLLTQENSPIMIFLVSVTQRCHLAWLITSMLCDGTAEECEAKSVRPSGIQNMVCLS